MSRKGDSGVAQGSKQPTKGPEQLRQRIDVTRLTLDQRRAMAKDIFITYPKIRRIFGLIDQCLLSGLCDTEPKSMYIAGDPGAGKSFLVEEYIKRTAKGDQTGDSPFLSVSLASRATPKTVSEIVLSALGDPFTARSNNGSLQHRLARLIHARQKTMIFIDECQHLTESGTAHAISIAAEWLKSLITLTKIPIIALGQETGADFLQDPQLNRRFGYRESIEPFSLDTEFAEVIRSLDDALPLAAESPLLYIDMIEPVWTATGGVMFFLTRLIKAAAFCAIEKGRESITRQDLAWSFGNELRNMRQTVPHNPFN